MTNVNLSSLSTEELAKLKRNMEIKEAQLKAAVETREKQITAPSGAAKYMKYLASGDALTINNVIWPYFHTVASDVIAANGGQQKLSFQVTQEAAFVMTEIVKVVFAVDFEAPTCEYINPRDAVGNGDANGLRFSLVDGDSTRSFMNDYVPLDQIGVPSQPFVLDRPMLLLPLQLFEINMVNNNTDRDFVTFMMFKGYKIRLEGQQDLVNLVTG